MTCWIQKKMNRIWWFGKIDMLYNELVPEVELVNRIILTMQHGMNHNDQNCIAAVGTTMPPYEDLSYIIQNMCRLTTSRIRPDPSLRLMSLHALRVIQHFSVCPILLYLLPNTFRPLSQLIGYSPTILLVYCILSRRWHHRCSIPI